MTPHNDDVDRLWRAIRRVFRLPTNARRLDREVDDELRFHIEGRVEELMAVEGLSRADAESEAHRRFGDFTRYRHEARDIDAGTHRERRRMEIRDTLKRETLQALRSLRRAPGFTTVAVVTLALGIGAATAIFTLLDRVVLRPLPYANADRLVALSSPVEKLQGQSVWGLGRHELFYFRSQGHSLENIGLYQTSKLMVLGAGDERPERAQTAQTSSSLFDVLGFAPERGRLFVPDDNLSQKTTMAVLSYGFWQRRFAGDPSIVGKTMNVEGQSLSIVGVLRRGDDLPDLKVDFWTPAWVDSTRTVFNNHTWSAIGRLRPGFTAADAERDLGPLTARMEEVFPTVYNKGWFERTGFRTKVVPLRDAIVGAVVTRALWALFGAVALVLLIAAANVANLFLVRLDARRREVAVRTALGADRAHMAWHYLTESMVLTLASGALATFVAWAMLRLLLQLAPSELPRLSEVHLSNASIIFAFVVAAAIGLVFGLLPIASASVDIAMLREGGRGMTSSRARMTTRHSLVMAQMAFAVVLLASAGLMIRTFRNLRDAKLGIDPRGVLAVDVALPDSRYMGQQELTQAFYDQLVARVAALPGVVSTGLTDRLPLKSGILCNGVTFETSTPDKLEGTCPPTAVVSPGYFETMGIPVSGRTLDWASMRAREGGMIVSRAFATHHWPNESPIGKGVRFTGTAFYRIIGVAEDVHAQGVGEPATEYPYFPMIAIPDSPLYYWGLWSPRFMYFVIKTTRPNPLSLAGDIARIAQDIDPQVVVDNATTMETVVAQSYARQSFTMALLLIAAGIALLLSAVGIYGVLSYLVQQRRGEIGVRVALGAQLGDVTSLVLRQSLVLAGVGVIVGIGGAIATTRFLSVLLYGVKAADPFTLLIVPVVLLGVALLASYLPARRAARIDPVEALRSE